MPAIRGAMEVEPVRSAYLWNPKSASNSTFSCRQAKPTLAPDAIPMGVKGEVWLGCGFLMTRVPVASIVFMPEARQYTSNFGGLGSLHSSSSGSCALDSGARHTRIATRTVGCIYKAYRYGEREAEESVTLSQAPQFGVGLVYRTEFISTSGLGIVGEKSPFHSLRLPPV